MACKGQRSNAIRKKLHEISRHLTTKDLQDFKYLAADWFGSGELEKINTIIEFFKLVIDRSESNDQIIRYVTNLLKSIEKPRLAATLENCMYY